MPSYSRLVLIGHLGRDPEMRYLPDGRPVTNFSVAISNRRQTPDGNWEDGPTDWWKCSCWNKDAERANEQLRKGQLVYVEGKPSGRSYVDKNNEVKVSLECSVSKWLPLSKREAAEVVADDEVPFA